MSFIKITHIENPHLFWFKYTKSSANKTLQKLEEHIDKYVKQLPIDEQRIDSSIEIDVGNIVAAYIDDWQRYIRVKVESIGHRFNQNAFVDAWAIDYGYLLKVNLENIVPLYDKKLANYPAINVFIGGLSRTVPATFDILDKVRAENWSESAIDYFNEFISNEEKITFEVDITQKNRHFGRLDIHMANDKIVSINERMCEHRGAILYDDYQHDIPPLNRENFRRLHHQPNDDGCVAHNSNLNSRLSESDALVDAFFDVSLNPIETITPLNNNEVVATSHSSIHVRSPTASNAPVRIKTARSSEVVNSQPLSIVNKIFDDALIVTDGDISPTIDWNGTFYFPFDMQTYLKSLLKNMGTIESYVWPHLMHLNSAIVVDNVESCIIASLPALCARVLELHEDQPKPQENSNAPIALILTANALRAENMKRKCTRLMSESNITTINVSYLSGSRDIKKLKPNTDILICSVFCYKELLNAMPEMEDGLQFVYFSEIDQMCDANGPVAKTILNAFFSRKHRIQSVITTETYCPMLDTIYSMLTNPLLILSKNLAFEAAIFANTKFIAEYIPHSFKYDDLIYKLDKIEGSIVIVCKDKKDLRNASEFLYEHHIDHFAFGLERSINRIVLNRWIYQNKDASLGKNILVTDDEMLPACSTQFAQHIIHFSSPANKDTILQRYEACMSAYQCQMDRMLNQRETPTNALYSIIYFDEQSDGLINILPLLSYRAKCLFPQNLIDLMNELFDIKERYQSFKPLCKELITKSVDCDHTCSFRHSIKSADNLCVPKSGFVRMKLIDILAPNHFAMKITSHRNQKTDEWIQLASNENGWQHFYTWLLEFYTKMENHIQHENACVGDICAVFKDASIYRCRILSLKPKSSTCKVYFIDLGLTARYETRELLRLNDEFGKFPPQIVEVFLLGIAPSDYERDFTPFAQYCTEKYCIDKDHASAEIVIGIEHILLVKDMKLLDLNRKTATNLARNLIKNKVAVETPVSLHSVFIANDVVNTVYDAQERAPIREIPEADDSHAEDSMPNYQQDFDNFCTTLSMTGEKPLSPVRLNKSVMENASPDLLINFNEPDEILNVEIQSPDIFGNVRIINSIDDLL